MFTPSSAACRLNGHRLPLMTIVGIHQFEEFIELGYIKINSHFFVFVNKKFFPNYFIYANTPCQRIIRTPIF